MKSRSTAISDFEFHDAVFTLADLCGGDLVVHATELNIHRSAPQNDRPTDMELSLAHITFHDFRAASFEPGRVWKRDALGHSYPVGPQIIYEGAQADERLLHELRNPMTVYEFVQEDGLLRIDGCGDEPWFTAQFACSDVTIEWDDCRRPAWYVSKRKE